MLRHTEISFWELTVALNYVKMLFTRHVLSFDDNGTVMCANGIKFIFLDDQFTNVLGKNEINQNFMRKRHLNIY